MQMVKFFQEYSLCEEPGSKIEETIGCTDLELDDLMKGFDPEADYIDKLVLFMLTGRNLDHVMRDWLDAEDQDSGIASLDTNEPPKPGTRSDKDYSIQGKDEPLL